MNSAMMIYIFFLVVPLLVTVPTLAMGGISDDVASAFFERQKSADKESGRRSRRVSGAAELPTDTQKVDAFLQLMNADERTKVIVNNPTKSAYLGENVFEAYASNSESALENSIKQVTASAVEKSLRDLDTPKRGNPIYIASKQLDEEDVSEKKLSNPYVPTYSSGTLTYYIVTIFNDKDGPSFMAHRYTPAIIYSDTGSKYLSGTMTKVHTTIFSKTAFTRGERGVYVYARDPKGSPGTHECLLERVFVSEDVRTQMFVFHWVWSSHSSTDDDKVAQYTFPDHNPLLVLSDGRGSTWAPW